MINAFCFLTSSLIHGIKYVQKGELAVTLSQTQKDEIVDILINIDDPFYLNTFVDDDDEQEWFHINERRMFLDMQRYLPMIDLNDQENWAFVRRCFLQFQ
ncbi:hypothetical protein DSM07_08160 [Oenococcus sp. UCMA 16435]|nr:hypothetical protein DSM07_08160 [Oenococcus sp. UCMA 16435]